MVLFQKAFKKIDVNGDGKLRLNEATFGTSFDGPLDEFFLFFLGGKRCFSSFFFGKRSVGGEFELGSRKSRSGVGSGFFFKMNLLSFELWSLGCFFWFVCFWSIF